MVRENKKIAKNTFFLYFRMMLTIAIQLYTSRVVLKVLGIDDFGIYQVVGGVVAMLAFLSAALSTGSSRFLTFELGVADFSKLKKTFNTILNIHILLSVIVIILAETIGLWFVYHKLAIPDNRFDAALWVYHFSVITSVIALIQVPYNASIISHEKMDIYAYMSIVDVTLKLGLVYLLQYSSIDNLVFYAFLLCLIQVVISLFYIVYCNKYYKETIYSFVIDKVSLKSIIGFSSWSLFASVSGVITTHGTTIITNMFFGPAVVAARVISNQVNMAANQFVSNFRLAVNPQIVKMLAVGDFDGSKKLLLESTKFSFYLMLLLGLPIILLAKPLLNLWLEEVPDYTVIFLQLVIVQSLFSVFDTSFYTALYAKGQLRENALVSPFIGFIQFPVIYLFFKMGYSPLVVSYVGIMTYFVLGFIVKPLLICKVASYPYKEVVNVLVTCLNVTLFALPIPLVCSLLLEESFLGYILLLLVTTISILVSIWIFGLNKGLRKGIIRYVHSHIKRVIRKDY